MDGSATYASVALGNCRVVNFEATRQLIPTTVKGDLHEQGAAGVVTHKLTFSGILDYVTGQQDLIDFLEATTPDVTVGTLVFTIASGKTWTWTSGALLVAYRVGSPLEDVVTFEADFHLNVKATIAWV